MWRCLCGRMIDCLCNCVYVYLFDCVCACSRVGGLVVCPLTLMCLFACVRLSLCENVLVYRCAFAMRCAFECLRACV